MKGVRVPIDCGETLCLNCDCIAEEDGSIEKGWEYLYE